MASSSPSSLFADSASFFAQETSPFAPPPSSRHGEKNPPSVRRIPLDATEVETNAAAIEIVIRWGQDILHIEHLETARSYAVGEEGADFVLPSDKLGAMRAELVTMENGVAHAVILSGSTVKIVSKGRTLTLADAITEKLAVPSITTVGVFNVALGEGVRVKMERDGFQFEVATVNAGRKVAGKSNTDRRAFGGQAVSLAIHGIIAASMLAFMPALAATDDGDLSSDQTYMLQAVLQQAEADRAEEIKTDVSGEAPSAGNVNEKGGAEKPTPGANTNTTASKQPKAPRLAHVSTDEKERALDKAAMIKDAMTFGMIDLIGTEASQNHAAAPWGTKASGPDSDERVGALWGDELNDGLTPSGLDLSTTGDPSGGPFKGNFLTSLDTGGPNPGRCFGILCGTGNSPDGRMPPGYKPHDVKPPRGTPEVKSGVIPAEVIQRVVRQSFGRFRACYQNGLRTNPSLAGRVVVSFTVGRDGSVGLVKGGGDMPDAGVISCVTQQFYGLSFPAPESGVVHVTYPLMFSPES